LGEVVFVVGDAHRFVQILSTFLGNAAKFTAEGQIEFVAEVDRVDEHRHSVELKFSVRDSGIGIDPDFLPKICQPYSLADSKRTRNYGGIGLSLFVSKYLIERMGGHLTISSEPCRGACFSWYAHIYVTILVSPLAIKESSHRSLTLETSGKLPHKGCKRMSNEDLQPLLDSLDPDGTMHRLANEVQLADTPVTVPPRILLVDDNKLNQKIIESMLEKFRYKVETADNGNEAVVKVQDLAPLDVLLMVPLFGVRNGSQ